MVSSSVLLGIQERVSVSSAYSQAPFVLFSLFNFNVLVFILSLYIILYYIVISLKPAYFLIRNRKGVHPEKRGRREELRRVKGGKIIMRIYYVRKKSISNKWG